jgi:hypothetical protein
MIDYSDTHRDVADVHTRIDLFTVEERDEGFLRDDAVNGLG